MAAHTGPLRKPLRKPRRKTDFERGGRQTRGQFPSRGARSQERSRSYASPAARDESYYEALDKPETLDPDYLAERYGPYALRLRAAGKDRDALAVAIARLVGVSEVEVGAICSSASCGELPLIVDGLDLLQATKARRYLQSLGAKAEVYDTRDDRDRCGAIVEVERLNDAEIVRRLRKDFAQGTAAYRDYVAQIIRDASGVHA